MATREIGNWIYLRYDNYKKYEDRNGVLAAHKKMIQNLGRSFGSSDAVREDLQKSYDFLFAVLGGKEVQSVRSKVYNKDFIKNVGEQIVKALIQAVETDAGIAIGNTNIESTSLAATTTKATNVCAQRFRALSSHGKNSKKAVDKRWAELKKAYEAIDPSTGIISQSDISKIENIKKNYDKYWEEYTGETGRIDWIYSSSENYSGLRTIIDDISELSSRYRTETDTEVQGAIGEYAALIGPYIYQLYCNNQLHKILEEDFVKGFLDSLKKDSSNRLGDKSGINIYQTDKFLQPRSEEEQAIFDIGAAQVKLISRQPKGVKQKVDVHLSLPEWSDNYFVGASVKNVKSNKVHILSSGAGIIYKVLQRDTVFANHFLNITSSHTDPKDTEQPLQATIQTFRRMAKWSIAAYALAGGLAGPGKRFGHEEAQYFVWNDPRNPGFKVYSISDIIDQMEHKVETMTIFEENGGSIDDTWDNSKHGKSYNGKMGRIRIFRVLAQVKKIRLSISLNMNSVSMK